MSENQTYVTGWQTAIHRKGSSLPIKWLAAHEDLAQGNRTLDYGCGRGTDAKQYGWLKWDPFYSPVPDFGITCQTSPRRHFDTVLCTYVLNILPPEERVKTFENIERLLTQEGLAYFTVRRDINAAQQGRGCIQRYISLPWTSIRRTPGYQIYRASAADIREHMQ